MKTLLTLFLVAGFAAPAFSQASINLSRDTTVLLPQLQPFHKIPADGFLKKLRKGTSPGFLNPPVDPNAKKRDSILEFLYRLSPKQSPVNNMPNAISVQPFPSANSVYKGNNGEGFDIYGSGIDNMPVLMPDSANAAMLRLGKVARKPKQ
jgi:hypothetical protein